MMRVAVIGAGAAGCFCAIETARRLGGSASVTVFEAGPKALAKVAVTGGGRCNLTNSFEFTGGLGEVYPRGLQAVRRAFKVFDHRDTMEWFAREGVALTVQEDGCVFPVSQDAMQIVRTLEREMRRAGVVLRTGSRVTSVVHADGGFEITAGGGKDGSVTLLFDRVVVATGGSPKMSGMDFMAPLGLEIETPVPSLYTLNIGDMSLRSLAGAVIEDATLALAGTGFRSRGALLVTDWGISGPATLRLSSYAARHLAGNAWKGTLLVGWLGWKEQDIREWLSDAALSNGPRLVSNSYPQELTSRVWKHVLQRAGIRAGMRWAELGGKGANRLVQTLLADEYEITGRCRFKEEFVTCGGVSLTNVNISTLESRKYPGLYFAGEALDIDAVTGGFNLQAAWSTGMVAAIHVSKSMQEPFSLE